MASAKSIFLCLLVLVASTVLQAAQADTVLLRGTSSHDTLPRRHLLQDCGDVAPGTGDGPVAAQTVTAENQKCFISVIQAQWEAAVQLVPNLSAKLSRMQFHDAATGHQDASLALNKGETQFGPNLSVRGIEALKLFKGRIFKDCGSTISWADTLVLATAIGYEKAGGNSMASMVPLGRGDNAALDTNINLPGPGENAGDQLTSFRTIFGPKYSAGDVLRLMVTLEGAHTLGSASCGFARIDATVPDIEPNFLAKMQQTCNAPSCPHFPLDSTNARFDNGFFRNVIAKKGVFFSDHSLFFPGVCVGRGGDRVCSRNLVKAYASNQDLFLNNFKWAFCHLSIVGTPLTCPPTLTFQDPIQTR